MKKSIAIVIIVMLTSAVVQAAEPYGGKRNFFTFSLGGYWPQSDLEDEGYKSGGDFDVTYMRSIKDWFGFGSGMHTYGTDSKQTSGDIGDGTFASTSIEMLFFMQPNHWQIQPYFGIGPAIYYNFLEYEADVGDEKSDESGVGLGGVFELGVRAFITSRFFGGMSFKSFINQWNLDIDENTDKTYNFGGTTMAFELGFTF